MNKYLRWYANLHKFYRIIFLAGMTVGAMVLGAGMVMENPFVFAMGLFWLGGTPGIIHLVTRFENR